MGLNELRDAFRRAQEQSADAAGLQAAWERSEMAQAELANGNPHLNAQALISINSALDAMVEEWVPAMRQLRVRWIADHLWERASSAEPEAVQQLEDDAREKLLEALREAIADSLPKGKRLQGSGAQRYEIVLAQEGLGAPADRPIPADFDEALGELGALRDVLIHRAGRVDDRALTQAPSLRYADGHPGADN